jgi:hypothetical protein
MVKNHHGHPPEPKAPHPGKPHPPKPNGPHPSKPHPPHLPPSDADY